MDGDNAGGLAGDTDEWASLSEAELRTCWYALESPVMKVVVRTPVPRSTAFVTRTYYVQRFSDAEFNPFHAIRNVQEWGVCNEDYRICEPVLNPGCYDAELNSITQDGQCMKHWEDNTVRTSTREQES